MLEICRSKLAALRNDIELTTLKMSTEDIELPDNCADVITLNSILHHIPDSTHFLLEIKRILKPGGLLLIGHEPNRRFYSRHAWLPAQAALLHSLAPRRLMASILKLLKIYQHIIRPTSDALLDKMNTALKSEGLIDKPLTRHTLSSLIDVHSPTAGGLRRTEGFDPFVLSQKVGGFTVKKVETYNHLSKVSGKYLLLRPYEKLLSIILPKDGAIFFMVAEKFCN